MNIRQVLKSDQVTYQQIRLEALEKEPYLFADSFEQLRDRDLSFYEQELENRSQPVFGAFVDEQLVGIISLRFYPIEKMAHKAMIGRFYVKEKVRGQSIGKALFEVVMEKAKGEGIEQIQLVVAATNEQAIKVYEKQGFQRYAYEVNALKVGDVYVDEMYYVKKI
ncbi:GNAT family N-acetyltransferase [Alkalihalobacillus pseudalcaliphilus]|uniref:GNAT family N-acetyltransferase n=1 Tax=Alkalihalobacillus pseudalcaliphilus TaxID=79884 RepID=UPI00064DD6F9|nr:GNAT family N-acetyltransferase [Alkalihalobacillus pseudalcaliphilus]KMK74782.1 hypothetical protein AB990_20075 [Alkalihalobacillus pseudalcaliphilus]